MNTWILLAVSMLTCLLNGTINKIYVMKWNGHSALRFLYSLVTGVVSMVVLMLWKKTGDASTFTVFLGIVFGIITALQSVCLLNALRIGSYAYTSVIIALSTFIPALSGCLIWNEKLGISQIIGMILLAVCVVLSVDRSAKKKKVTVRWLVACGITFLCTGSIGVLQKIHQSSSYQDELDAFLIIAFFCSCLFSSAYFAFYRKREGSLPFTKKDWIIALVLLVSAGICVAVNNKLNLYLSGIIDSAVFFPLVNGGHLVLTTFVAVLFFHEKQTVRQWIGLISGIIAVVFLCNMF